MTVTSDLKIENRKIKSKEPSLKVPRPPCRVCTRVVSTINRLARATYPTAKPNGDRLVMLDGLHARHQEHGIRKVFQVLRVKRPWLEDPAMLEYYNPVVLFRPESFARYLGQPVPPRGKASSSAILAAERRLRAVDVPRMVGPPDDRGTPGPLQLEDWPGGACCGHRGPEHEDWRRKCLVVGCGCQKYRAADMPLPRPQVGS